MRLHEGQHWYQFCICAPPLQMLNMPGGGVKSAISLSIRVLVLVVVLLVLPVLPSCPEGSRWGGQQAGGLLVGGGGGGGGARDGPWRGLGEVDPQTRRTSSGLPLQDGGLPHQGLPLLRGGARVRPGPLHGVPRLQRGGAAPREGQNCRNDNLSMHRNQRDDGALGDSSAGWGLFIGEVGVSKGQFVTEYVGEVVSRTRPTTRASTTTPALYLFNLNADFCIDAARKGNKCASPTTPPT